MRSLSDHDRFLFARICMPAYKKIISEEAKGKILYALNRGELADEELAEAFPEDFAALQEVLKKRPLLGLFDKTNYVYKYFFEAHNKIAPRCKVLPAQLIGFKAERRAGKSEVIARVRFFDSKISSASLELFPTQRISDISLNDYILIHKNAICCRIPAADYAAIVRQYFTT